ncbi:bromodomain-containing protein [Microdochium trichocladiopsis]|uniref:SAGA complex subunit Spt7 n=1 Tax=Microdochium trichocladiopsis TaxID=1682393 RepID=A0A9P9BM24_9PEZI|nr:bromodomain-containing protein [Microdochium trichocladiopsis]KAH7029183.1 bromodomain-containing protein [Microdochium trichocladiopsis]
MNGQTAWQTPGNHQGIASRSFHYSGDGPAQDQTPLDASMGAVADPPDADDDASRQRAHFLALYRRSEARISSMFRDDGSYNHDTKAYWEPSFPSAHSVSPPPTTDHRPIEERPAKRVKRVIDEDDYGDDDSDDEEGVSGDNLHAADGHNASPLKHKSAATASKGLLSPTKSGSSPVPSVASPEKTSDKPKDGSSQESQSQQHDRAKTLEETRKQLEDARKDTEEAAKRGFHTLFYTLENDRTAMLEQQQLEESEKQLQAEMDKNSANAPAEGTTAEHHGSLSSANLGASSLTLKHLIARIDMKRDMVRASDAELRSLMNEVRKNRSKWASEENVNQEELYEALEKVLTELKAHTEFSTPFLQRVNKRDAPDYYHTIKQPMDLGTMTKKLKSLTYKSKQDFVADLNLIWDNCLKYNAELNHPLRRMANGMRKEAEKLIPLIPELTIRSRAEVEAEERRKQNGGEDDAGDDSDDEPIMSSRGRITGGTKGTKSRKAPSDQKEDTPGTDQKPILPLNGLLAKAHREGSDLDGSNGFGSPAIGAMTPNGLNGTAGTGSNVDAMDIDEPSLHGMALGQALTNAAQPVYEDEEYKIWKQVTKKDRALVARERQQLFAGNKLNVDEPALLRTKAGMRRYLKSLQQAEALGIKDSSQSESVGQSGQGAKATETLAEGMEEGEEKVIPDYYQPQSLIPDIPPQLQWIEDGEGQVINQFGEYLREMPAGYFSAPKVGLAQRFDANLRQMQETRKVCSKISVIKQMQLQTQVYANQFPKYNPEPFVEVDVDPHVTSGDDLVMAPEVCRAAMQRSVAKIFYHAGFEELQPSALDTITDIATDYFGKIVGSFNAFSQVEMKDPSTDFAKRGAKAQPRCSGEEVVLHTLAENGYSVEALESYAKDEVERLGNKLGVIHERMKAHLSDLLRPALHETNQEGANFRDGSDQFVGGDFAEDIGEDFFGFKELGLAGELGGVLSVPLHLLQSRVRNQYQAQNPTTGETTDEQLFEEPPPLEAVTKENIQGQIGLVKNFFLAKLHANGDSPLVEDEDLPVKQRRPRPRLGATGKIVSPQKRPPKEQNAINKKKKKLEAQAAAANKSPEKPGAKDKKPTLITSGAGGVNGISLPTAPGMERLGSMQSHTDKDDTGMMSPESMER